MSTIDVSSAQDGGCMKIIKEEGKSESTPSFGSEVTVHYTGTLLDGTQFDSSRGRGEFKFTLGQGQVIKGWDDGVKSMKKGERADFTLKPEYAYGEAGSPPKIPANATLCFDIELISWKAEDISIDGDASLLKTTVKKGPESWTKVTDACQATINCKILKEGDHSILYDYGKLEFEVGEAEIKNLPYGVNTAVKKMHRGDICHLECKGKNDLTKEMKKILDISENAEYIIELQLCQFEKQQEVWEMSDDTRIEQATIAKEKGTLRLKSNNHSLAIHHYKRVIDLLDHQETKANSDKFDAITASFNTLKLAANLNLSLVYPKINEHYRAISAANEAIKIDDVNEKSYFRRASAHFQLNDFDSAKNDYAKVVKINPENKTAAKQVKVCADKVKKAKEEEKRKFSLMFK